MRSINMNPKPEEENERLTRLARVRENQRKSRARRQQYIEELEQKVAVCNTQAQQREIEHLIALQKVEAENAKLRSLLHRVGFDSNLLEDYLRNASQPTASEKIAIPRLGPSLPIQTPSPSNTCCSTTSSTVSRCSSSSPGTVESVCKLDTPCSQTSKTQDTPTIAAVPAISKLELAPVAMTQKQTFPAAPPINQPVKLPPISSLCDCGPESMTKWPGIETPMNTTLCDVAQDMINQYNTQGLDLDVIKQRLWKGFRNGDSSGCRVQNNVLFEVLDEISGDAPMSAGT